MRRLLQLPYLHSVNQSQGATGVYPAPTHNLSCRRNYGCTQYFPILPTPPFFVIFGCSTTREKHTNTILSSLKKCVFVHMVFFVVTYPSLDM